MAYYYFTIVDLSTDKEVETHSAEYADGENFGIHRRNALVSMMTEKAVSYGLELFDIRVYDSEWHNGSVSIYRCTHNIL